MSFSLVGLLNTVTRRRRSKRLASGLAYGPRPMQRLDLYRPARRRRCPVR